jgi:hypothetical protein
MSSPTPTATQPAPYQVHTVHFAFPGSQAIRLREHSDNGFVGVVPEWSAGPPRNDLVAYVRASQPVIRVVFRGAPGANGTYAVGADGAPSQVAEQQVSLVFDPASGLSQALDFGLVNPLPDQVGLHHWNLDWYARDPSEQTIFLSAGSSTHRVCTTWRPMVPNPDQGLPDWTYRQIVEWTCRWSAGLDGPKSICDAIIRSLPGSGLRYGENWHDVREMLQNGGGMCGGWYQMFQQMAHCQGIFVHRRCFLVHWRAKANGEVLWCGIVIQKPGLNQPHPTFPSRDFFDNDIIYPPTAPVALATRKERRYRFLGVAVISPPDWYGDGHCVNFLEHAGRVYLYDACFGIGPIEFASPVPPDDYSIHGGVQLSSFKALYLDRAVDYMLGSVYNGSVLVETVVPGMGYASRNGMTVKTSLIQDVVNGEDGITFYWGG